LATETRIGVRPTSGFLLLAVGSSDSRRMTYDRKEAVNALCHPALVTPKL
jgi:hypothetical protein